LTDFHADDSPLNTSDKTLLDRVKGLGQIVIKAHRVKVLGYAGINKYKRHVDAESDSVPEKALKGRALSRRTE
jgi:hypothetical protein